MRTDAVLVIGATGILGPAAASLRAAGRTVVAVSRRGGAGSIGVDARDVQALRAVLDEHAWTDAVVYGPAVSPASSSYVRAATPGRFVIVRTSADADPARGMFVVPQNVLQLGWTAGATPRWHTPDEVSRAALAILEDGQPRVLGTVRPWRALP